MPFVIFVVLGIGLKSSHAMLWLRFTFVLALLFLAFGVFTTFVWEFLTGYNIFIIMGLLAVIALSVAYIVVSYTLSSLFKTNHALNVLLKDTLHELNIPLSVISANLQMLQASEIDPKGMKRLERIALASKDLEMLYRDVDYYIKKEIQVDIRESFFIDEVVHEIVEKYQEMSNGVEIHVSLLHVKIIADKRGFMKVISNLIGNALKYNRNAQAIKISYEFNQLIIEDHGIGMSESELFLAFNRYYQANPRYDGYGIGLSLVKAYCDEFEIALSINSLKNIGTKISLNISHLIDKK